MSASLFTIHLFRFRYNSVINTPEHVFGNNPGVSMKNDRNGRIFTMIITTTPSVEEEQSVNIKESYLER